MLPSKSDGTAYKGEHEPIIDEVTFNRAQALLKAKAEHYDPALKHPFKAVHLLTGITYCGECGGRVSCVGSHQYVYYGCHRYTDGDPRHKIKPKCKTPNYNVKKLDAIVINEVLKLSYDDNAIKELIKPRYKVDHRKAIKSLEKQKTRLIDLYSVGGIDLEELTIRINAITKKLDDFRNEEVAPPELSFADAKKIFANVKEIFNTDDTERQRAVLQSLIKKIVLDGNEIKIYWRFE